MLAASQLRDAFHVLTRIPDYYFPAAIAFLPMWRHEKR